ncbi:Halomucin [Frankliniella fusca]|uniref:Halomucin n=1 Tax=Frankliniella fusca TaxID=407009 RepID=A0AAE1LT69_9NEOP|nr:Halomucin [Frankliniella fusca]
MATFSKNGQPNRAYVQQKKSKPVKVSSSTADPRTSVASNGLILGKANGRKPTNTASQRANVRSEFIPPRILNSSNKLNQGDKHDHAIQSVSKNLFQECDDSDATSDDELFRNEDVDEEFNPSWKPDEDNEDDDDDDGGDILASEDEEQDGNESVLYCPTVPLNVPEHESHAGTQSDDVADDEADQEAADETPKTISKKKKQTNEMQRKRNPGQEYIQINVLLSAIRDLDSDKNKEVVWQYFFTINGERHQFCKSTFLDTLGETDTFLRRCQAKVRETVSGIAPKERRGVATPQHAHTPDFKDLIRAHINKFPAYVSHYCRKQTKQKYLSSTLSRIFRTMGLKFKQPPQDTCNKCDELKAKIKFAKSEEDENRLKTEHLRKAEEAYKLKRIYKNLSKEDKSVKCLVFDLEQVFATPNVSCGKAYYLRQLSTCNLTIVDCSNNNTFNYMWHEGEASRGASEIASCLFTHIMDEIDEEVTQLFLFSDCCSDQNRNSIVAAMLSVALETHVSLKGIDHIFLIPGHTRMECDAKHSRIEHQKEKSDLICVPSQWYEVVKSFGPLYKSCFPLVEMAPNFVNFPELLEKDGPLIMRDNLEDNSKMYWTKTHWFQYNKHSPGIIKVKSSFAVDSEFAEYNMIRGNGKKRKLAANWFSHLKHKEIVNAISQAKMKDLRDLLKYIPETHHQFYKSLKVDCALRMIQTRIYLLTMRSLKAIGSNY